MSIEINSGDLPKVLIVEDDFVSAFLIKQILDGKYETIITRNRQETIKKINEEIFQLLLIDINLSDDEMDGVAIMKEIRNNMKFNAIKIYAVSGFVHTQDKYWFIQQGFDGIFTKPINKLEMLKEIEVALKITKAI